MTEKSLDGEQVRAVFIEMGTKSVPQGMTGDALRPAEGTLHIVDMARNEEGINRPVFSGLFRKEEAGGPAKSKPVLREDVQGPSGEDGISAGAVLAMADKDAHFFTADILIAQRADLPNPQAGGIEKADHGFQFQVRHGIDEGGNLLSGRDIREETVKLP